MICRLGLDEGWIGPVEEPSTQGDKSFSSLRPAELLKEWPDTVVGQKSVLLD